MLKRKLNPDITDAAQQNLKKLPNSPPISDFPSDVLKWMKKNVANPKMSLKLMQICKYYQHSEFPYFVVKDLQGNHHSWHCTTFDDNVEKQINFDNLPNKLWIANSLCLYFMKDIILNLLPKIAVCDVSTLDLTSIDITFEQFKLLAGNVTEMKLSNIVIKNDNGDAVPFENIFECLPNVETFLLKSICNSFVSYQKATECIPPKLRSLELSFIHETFDIDECFKFIKVVKFYNQF